MMRLKLWFCCSLVIAFPISAHMLTESDLRETILHGIDLTLRQEYPQARAVFQSVISTAPSSPAGYIYLAGTIQAEYSDFEDGFDRPLFDSLLAVGEALADRLIDSKDSADWGYYYAGTVLSYRAFSESERGGWASVIIDGMNSAKMFERCLDVNPTFYDAMCGLGTYYYWRSKKTEFISWLPFVSDKKARGIVLLQAAHEHGSYEKFTAMNSLALVLTEERRYDEAMPVIQEALSRYPDNRSFLWCLVGVEERRQIQDTAALHSAVTRLLESVINAPVRNCYYECACRLKVAQFAFDAGRFKETVDQCNVILKYGDQEGKTKRDIGKKLRAAMELRDKAKLQLSEK